MCETLFCNIPNCGVPLTENAWVTICRHVFCPLHGSEYFYNNRPQVTCPVCDEIIIIESEVKMCSTTENPLILAGMRPETILKMLQESMKLWKQQLDSQKILEKKKFEEFAKNIEESKLRCKEAMLAREAQLDIQIETLQAKYRKTVKLLERKVRELELARRSSKVRCDSEQPTSRGHRTARTSFRRSADFMSEDIDLENHPPSFDFL